MGNDEKKQKKQKKKTTTTNLLFMGIDLIRVSSFRLSSAVPDDALLQQKSHLFLGRVNKTVNFTLMCMSTASP